MRTTPANCCIATLCAILLPGTVLGATVEWQFDPTQRTHRDAAAETAQKRSFKDYKLLRLNPCTAAQLEWLHELYTSDTDSPPPFFDLDFWQPPAQLNVLVDVTVSPIDAQLFFDELRRRNFDYFVIADDLQGLIERERQPEQEESQPQQMRDDFSLLSETRLLHRSKEPLYRYDRYNPLTRIEEQLFRLREVNPRIVTLYEIGRSHENRSIVTAKVSAREHTPEERFRPYKGPAVWIDAGIHAREWIAPATAMLFIARLINGYNSHDANIRYLVEHFDWYITPVLNPDGYEYSHTKNRMWRKNRRPAFCKQQYFNRICCSGVDLNRNFDWFWSTTGSSSDPCHETYHGPTPFSEPESLAARDFLEAHPVKAYFTLHSYSQLWLIPYGHKKRNYPEDYAKIQRPLSLKAVQALQRLYGTEYQVGSGADLLYEASGASHDFAKGSLNVPFSFLIELRPQNTLHSTGFLLPEAEIMDTAEETWEAVKVVADEVLDKFGLDEDGKGLDGWKKTSTEGTTPVPSSTTTTSKTTTTLTPPQTTQWYSTIEAKTRRTTKKPSTRHTFRPNTVAPTTEEQNQKATTVQSVLTSKSLPVAGTVPTPTSGKGGKPGSRARPNSPSSGGGAASSSASAEEEEAGERKTIVNVKICTGKAIQPPDLVIEESVEETVDGDGEEAEGQAGGSLPGNNREILLPHAPSRLIKCRDWSAYCKWWRMHSLCSDPRVRKMCTLSCLVECQI